MSQSEKSRRQASEIRYYKKTMIYYFIYTEELTSLCPLVLKVWHFHYFTSEMNAIIQRQTIYIIYHTQCRFIVSIYQDEKRGNLSCIAQLQWVWDTLRTLDRKDVLRRKFIQSYLF